MVQFSTVADFLLKGTVSNFRMLEKPQDRGEAACLLNFICVKDLVSLKSCSQGPHGLPSPVTGLEKNSCAEKDKTTPLPQQRFDLFAFSAEVAEFVWRPLGLRL